MKFSSVAAGLVALCFAATTFIPLHVKAQEGPQTPSDTVAKPKKKPAEEAEPDQEKVPSKYKKKEAPEESLTFRSDATTVSVDVSVLDDKGRFIPKIPQGNFRVLEDGVPQQISHFGQGEAPMTICMLIEFSGRFQQFWSRGWYETLQASYGFLETLKPIDNVAVVAFDLRPTILADFSPDKNKAYEAMQRLRIPGFSESNIFDAMTDMAGRMENIEGRKAIVVIATGLDTFSKLTFDKTRKLLQEEGVPIYSVSILQIARELADAYGQMGAIQRMDFLQADNEMRTFTKETGGQAYFPRFAGEYPSVFRSISEALRNQYALGYHPTNTARDGKFRHLKVELVNPSTNEPLRITNEKGKAIKYQIIAKAGYNASREVE